MTLISFKVGAVEGVSLPVGVSSAVGVDAAEEVDAADVITLRPCVLYAF